MVNTSLYPNKFACPREGKDTLPFCNYTIKFTECQELFWRGLYNLKIRPQDPYGYGQGL